MADYKIDSNVQCTDSPCGKVKSVILNPVTKKVTHIVVEDRKFPQNSTRMVPVNKVKDASSTQVTLSSSFYEVGLMQPFEETRYIQERIVDLDYPWGYYYYFPYEYWDYPYDYSYKVENMPEGGLSVYPGMEVDASDGKIGRLDKLVIDPKSGAITHFLMKQGILGGEKDVTVPVSAVSSTDGGVIHLNLSKKAVGELPAVPIKHKVPGPGR